MTVHSPISTIEQTNNDKEFPKSNINVANGISDISIQQLGIAHISQYFIYNYYNIMSLEPEKLHLFYGDDSCLSFGFEGDQNAKDCNGAESIHKHFMSLGLKNSNISITTLDFQPSIQGCIVINILGDLIKSSHQPESPTCLPITTKFVQSFLLARQHNGYYILNDCMRYIRVPTILQRFPCTSESMLMHKLGSSSGLLQPLAPLDGSIKDSSYTDHKYQDIPDPSFIEHPITSDVLDFEDIGTNVESPTHSNPTSWASLVSNKIQGATTTPENTPVKCSRIDTMDLQHISDGHINNQQYGSGSAHVDLSVFIKGIQYHMTPSDILPFLEEFGEVTYIDVVVEKNCAFVNFKTPAGAKAAIGQVIHVDGCDLVIEQRKFKYGQRKYTQDGFQYMNRDNRRRHDSSHRHGKRGHNTASANVA